MLARISKLRLLSRFTDLSLIILASRSVCPGGNKSVPVIRVGASHLSLLPVIPVSASQCQPSESVSVIRVSASESRS